MKENSVNSPLGPVNTNRCFSIKHALGKHLWPLSHTPLPFQMYFKMPCQNNSMCLEVVSLKPLDFKKTNNYTYSAKMHETDQNTWQMIFSNKMLLFKTFYSSAPESKPGVMAAENSV